MAPDAGSAFRGTTEKLLQANRELQAANAELRRRVGELGAANYGLANLLACSQLPLVVVDRALRVRRFTPSAEKAFGLLASDIGKPLGALRLNVEAPRLRESVREVVEGSFLAKQLEARDRKGGWHSLAIRPYKTAANGVEGAVLSLADISEAKAAALAVSAAREYAAAIVDSVNDSLLVLNRHLKVKRASPFFHKLFKESAAEIEGRSIYELGDGRWNVPALRAHLSALAARRTARFDWKGEFDVPKLGRRTLTICGTLVGSGVDAEPSIVLAIDDVSLRKQAAEATVLRKNEARQRDFVANVSHELMTPIAAIKGYSESLVGGALEDSDKGLKFAKIIETHADRLTELVEDLLRLSLHDAGRPRAGMETVLLRPAVERLARGVASLARKRRVSLRVRVPETLKVSMNRVELNQVFQNLFENAVKYNRKGGRVYVMAKAMGRRAVVSVQDTGIGVPKKDLPLIFDRFHRAPNARLGTSRGNGLGLSIVRAILVHRGCRIWADSVLEKGTIVHFTLPLAERGRRRRRTA